METLETDGPIPFSGSVHPRDLREYLKSHEHVGGVFSTLLVLCIGPIALVLFFQGAGFSTIAVGMVGLLAVTLGVSTIAYRRIVFTNANPRWREEVSGELRSDGVHVERDNSRVFFRWDWYWTSIVRDEWIAVVPATQSLQPLFVTRRMLEHSDDWPRLLSVARAIAVSSDESNTESTRYHRNLSLLRLVGRRRSVDVPAGSIAFQGTISSSDLARLPNRPRAERPARSIFVVTALFCCGALIVAGASSLWFDHIAILPAIVALYVVLAALGIAVRTRRQQSKGNDVVYFQNMHADESGIVSDFELTVNEVSWSALKPVVRQDDFVALRRLQSPQYIIARRDMFDNEQDWTRFREMSLEL